MPAAPDRSRCDRWLNAVEGFFAKLTNRRLKRGVFTSIVDLQATINRFVADTSRQPRPFVWTADPDRIIAAVRRGYQTLDLIHSPVVPVVSSCPTRRLLIT